MIVSLCPLGRRFELGGRRDWEEHADEQRGGCKQSIAKCGHESPRRYARRSDARGTVPLGRRKSCDGHHLLLVCCRCVMAAKADIPNLRFVPKPARRWRGAPRGVRLSRRITTVAIPTLGRTDLALAVLSVSCMYGCPFDVLAC